MRKFGLLMELPEGKRAGFYAQIVKALAEAANVADRDKELIVVDSEEERGRVAAVLEKYRVAWEPLELISLPEGTELDEAAEDVGFVGRSGGAYLYADRVARFRLPRMQPAGADIAPAMLQLEEFIRFAYDDGGQRVYCAEPHLREAVEGVAKRYGAAVEFL
ncbi:hypothetical protein [Paenibacillus sp.]|uniref:hypothetical protein n=1 Tax=Paenibacillus sp. TaxID=58172 RepID=UPI002D43C841|nr:hypothetical protein [Paenibacillus sp.]HZG88286.1 hypothetical protein [Paenibacillus sp.]